MLTIALVYDLRDDYRAMGFSEEQVAEFDGLETIDALEDALTRLGCAVERVGHGRRLAERLVAGARWDLVFSIAEGIKGRSREAQVPALCELFDQPYAFSDPLTMAVTLDKAVAKRIVRDAGVPTAPFMVFEEAGQDLSGWMHYPAFVKPLAEGTGKGCERASMVGNQAELRAAASALVERFEQPALVEAYLPGREFTVGIVGNGAQARVIGVMEIILNANAEAGVYSFINKEECDARVIYRRGADAKARLAGERALLAYQVLQCRDASRIDMRCNADGEPCFMEVNPIAGLHPRHSDLPILARQNGIEFADLMEIIFDAALARHGLSRAAVAPYDRMDLRRSA